MLMEYHIVIIVLLVLIAFGLIFTLYTNKRDAKQKITLLEENIIALKERLKDTTNTLHNLESKSHKTTYVSDQIKKIEKLEDELLRQRSRVEEAKAVAQEASMVKYDFLTNVSHEIRTPMNSILVFAELLSQEIEDKKLLTYSHNIFQSGRKLLALLDDVIELSKIESGGFDLEESAVDIKVLLENVVQEQKSLALQKGLKLTLEIDDRLPAALMIDAKKTEEIFYNLLDNALKFTNRGFVKVSVRVTNLDIQKNSVDIVIVVEDSGVGIDKSNQEKIFKIFEKREDSTELEGTGLGLSINQKTASLMNGELSVQSDLNVGSSFSFSLYALEIVLISAEDETIDELSIDFSLVSPEGATIMVVDEDEDTHGTIQDCFRDTSVNIFDFYHPRDAIETLKSKEIDLIFIDVDMFSIDENAVSKVIAKMSKAAVVTLTQSSIKDITFEKGGARVIGHLKRPISRVELFKIAIKELNSSHLSTTDKHEVVFIEDEFRQLDKSNIQAFLVSHARELVPLYEKAIATNDLNAIKFFAQELLKIAKANSVEPLESFALGLLKHIDLFDIEEINSMMDEYKNKINRLQSL